MPEYTCTVVQAGAAASGGGLTPDPGVLLYLTDTQGSFPPSWFFAAQTAKNQMLAVALAAISTQSQVHVFAADAPVAGGAPPQINNLYIIAS